MKTSIVISSLAIGTVAASAVTMSQAFAAEKADTSERNAGSHLDNVVASQKVLKSDSTVRVTQPSTSDAPVQVSILTPTVDSLNTVNTPTVNSPVSVVTPSVVSPDTVNTVNSVSAPTVEPVA